MVIESKNDGNIRIMDSKLQEVTSINKIKSLFEQGYEFEASTAIATFIDGYLYFILNVNCEINSINLKRKKDERTGLLKITSGDAISIITKKYQFIADKKLIKELEMFVDERNFVVHNLAKVLNPVDFPSFFALCISILKKLDLELRKCVFKLEEHRKKVPQATQNQEIAESPAD